MAEDPKQKSNNEGSTIRLLNKVFLGLTAVAVLFMIFETYGFFKVYSKKGDELFKQGRIITIGAKDKKLSLNDIDDKEIALKKSEYQKKNGIAEENPNPAGDDFIGPRPKDAASSNTSDLIGPMPDKVADEKKALETVKVVDYKTANLSIIVTEIGLKQSELDDAKILPKEVSFAFTPYSDELQKKIDFAARDGRQVMLNLIFNPSTYPVKDGGPLSIQANYDEVLNLTHFSSTVNAAKKYTGLLANNDEIITSKFDKLSPLLKKIAEKNLFLGFFKTANNANLENDVKPFATDIFGVDYLVDEDPNEDEMLTMLDTIKEDLVIKKKRLVIAIRPYPASIKVLKKWLDENLGDNIQLAPISYFVTNN